MHKVLKWLLCLLLNAVFCTSAAVGHAETANDATLSPYFLIENGDPAVDRFPLKDTRVAVNINGVIADVVITQKYANGGTRPINARYVFPASTRASVHGMKMIIGEEVIIAEIKERQSAQNEFDQAKKQGKNASLLKQQRPNVFSMNVANIMPGDAIDIELHYTELLIPTEGIYEFVYPTVVGPRYANQLEAEAPETDRWIKNPYLKQGSEPETKFAINLTISAGMALHELVCPTHSTETSWESDSVAKIALAEPERFSGDRDFILNYRLTGEEIQSGLLLFEGEDENFFLLMVQPPQRVQPAEIPPREYIFVVDVSGSMNGFPLNTAKKLLRNLIGNLKATDKFNVILFAGGSRVMESSSVPAIQKNIQGAIRFIEKQRGGGGTELLAALRKGFSLPRAETVSRSMIIVTDGYIGAESDVFEEIQHNLNLTNVFSFGIGSSVNRYLIEGMAKAGGGEAFVVTKRREAREAAERFRRYVQSPLLTKIDLEFSGFETYDIEPQGFPDLFAQRPVIVFGKWRDQPRGTIELSGIGGLGDYSRIVQVADTKPLEANRALGYLWARTRIARLSDFNFKRGNPENKDEITTLGLTYNLLTAYTSFIAVHEDIRNNEGQSEDVSQPLPLPLNVSNLAVGISVSTVPEPEISILLMGVALMLAALIALKKIPGGCTANRRKVRYKDDRKNV
jgi:Ca-activated chloride channel family protein